MLIPNNSFAKVSNTSQNLFTSYSSPNAIDSVSYTDGAAGKVAITATMPFSKVTKYSNFTFFVYDETKTLLFQEEGVKGTDIIRASSGDGYFYYTFKNQFDPNKKYFITSLGYSEEPVDARDAASSATEITTPYTEADPFLAPTPVNMAAGAIKYTGVSHVFGCTVYQLNATEDCCINISGFTTTGSNGSIGIFDSLESARKASILYAMDGGSCTKSTASLTGFAVKKGTYYIDVLTDIDATFEFNMECRKYNHAVAKWSVAEGDYKQAFDQNKTITITFEITNADSDAYIPSDATWSAPGDSGNVTVSADGKKGTFKFKTRSWANTDEITIGINELNSEEGTMRTGYSIEIMTGASLQDLKVEVGPNYILFPDFNIPDYGNGSKAKLTVYLKNGKKWVKKFTVPVGTKKVKKIKGLKSSKKYTYKVEMTKKLTNGKTSKTSKKFTVKTGPKGKPAVASAKVSNYVEKKVWVSGRYDAGWVWHPGYWSTNRSYTLTVTLKSPLKGCKGLNCSGKSAKGKGTTFKYYCYGQPPKSVKVRGYSNDTYGGFTAYSSNVTVR